MKSGAGYVYVRTGATWALQAFIKASNTGAVDQFGSRVELSADGNTLAVSATSEATSGSGVNPVSNNSAANAGAVYVFNRVRAVWSQEAFIKATNAGRDDFFGQSIALSRDGNTLAVGSIYEDSSGSGVGSTPNESLTASGAVYIYRRAGTWAPEAFIKASNPDADDAFGRTVSLSGDGNVLVVGTFSEDSSSTGVGSIPNEGATDAGAAYTYTRAGSTWSFQSYIKPSNTGAGDFFGGGVALSGDGATLAISSWREDSSGNGPGTAPNEGAADSGAVYIFSFATGAWTQQEFIKASNTGANDFFGFTVGLSDDGNSLVVSAPYESSSGLGIGSIPNESSNRSGAAYLYTRTAGGWSSAAFIKASNTGTTDYFGRSACISADGTTIAVGANQEDSSGTGVGSLPNEASSDSGAAYVVR